MIPLHELRIGNLVLANAEGDIVKIEKGSDIDQQAIDYKAIPVTPEVLKKCGFSFHSYFNIWQKNKAVAGTGPDMELDRDFWVLDFSHRRIGVELKNLHHLQNIYFFLKGKELDIKEQ